MKIIRIITFCTLIVLSSFSTSRAQSPLVFGLEPLPPFNTIDERGNFAGPGVEVVHSVCAELQQACQIGMYPVKRLISMMNKKNLHGVVTMGKSPAREKNFHFSLPYTKTEYGFFVLSGSRSSLHNLEQFNGYTVITLFGSNMLATLEQVQKDNQVNFEIQTETTLEQAFRKLSFGRFDDNKTAIFANKDIGNYLIENNKLTNLDYILTQKSLNYHIGFPKNAVSKAFVDRFNAEMSKMHEDGRLTTILHKEGRMPPDLALYTN